MFEHLGKHRKILVTGPHRSGTTFAATAIHHDLVATHGLVREELCWKPGLDLVSVRTWLHDVSEPLIVQAPFVADVAHTFRALIVFMIRDVEDIKASQRRMFLENGARVEWGSIAQTELSKYNPEQLDSVPAVKYRSWEFQKPRIADYLELHYETLRDHPLWIEKDQRKDFHVRQTRAVA